MSNDKLLNTALNHNSNLIITSSHHNKQQDRPQKKHKPERIRDTILIKQQRVSTRQLVANSCQLQTMKTIGNNNRQVSTSLLALLAATLICAGLVCADHAQHHNHQLQDLSFAASNQLQQEVNYEQQHQQHNAPKAKKIQIVYIKVPLAKLKPSLANNDNYGQSSASGAPENATYGGQHDSINEQTKPQGSQSDQQQQQQQIGLDERLSDQQLSRQQDQQSFLIPMAVIQSASNQQPNEPSNNYATASQPQQLSQLMSSPSVAHNEPPNQFEQLRSNSGGRRSRQQQSPMQLYQQLMQSSPSVNHGINHGFMSSFLQSEKEKMGSFRVSRPTAPESAASTTTTTPSNIQLNNQQPKGMMMMPISMMPDNMIGQAYNAAVGQALPLESGSPASMLSSPSTDSNSNNSNNGKRNYGGAAGTNSEPGSSPIPASSGSYGSSGLSQQDNGSSGSAYQHSGSAYGASAPSSGYGSGISSFGASVAFSDYPQGSIQSTGSAQQTYGQSQPNSNSNNNNNHHLSHSQSDPADQYANQKLRQAKKTIIPIVVQVEHAIMEASAASVGQANNYNKQSGNKYTAPARGHRQLNAGKRPRNHKSMDGYRNNPNNVPYGAATNEVPFGQYINAANAQDINQITAAINAENAASAAAALAQADMALGNGSPAYIPQLQQGRGHQAAGGQRPGQQYASGLQSAASALLANSHPVIQAAASGGLASVSKLGAKLGEMIALPSMQVPNSIAQIGSALPSALSSISNQMGLQLGQAVQQVAKEHPTAHAFARQVAQHAGLNIPNFNANNQQNQQLINQQQQQQVAASNQHSQSVSPQAQLQNLKLSIGQNLQTAAAQLIGAHQKANAQSAASLLANPLAALYPQSMNMALKQISSGVNQPSVGYAPSSLDQQQQQQQSAQQQQQQTSSDSHSAASSPQSALISPTSEPIKAGKSSLKSKFLSFFQPPKFISNLLSWNDRADARNDQVSDKQEEKNKFEQVVTSNMTKSEQVKPLNVSLTGSQTAIEQPKVVKAELPVGNSTNKAN